MTSESSSSAKGSAAARSQVRDEIQRRIGRNVLNLQLVEQRLKFINTHAVLGGTVHDLQSNLERDSAEVNMSTLGVLAGRLRKNVLRPAGSEPRFTDYQETAMEWRYSVAAEADVLAQHDQEMKALVDARNELIHGFLPRWDAATDGDHKAALDFLDTQHAEITKMFERLDQWARNLANACLTTGEFLRSDEGNRQLELAFLLATRLGQLLVNIARGHQDPEGWGSLTAATTHIRNNAPQELHDLRKRFGHADLKTILKASGVFELQTVLDLAGQKCVHFRVNDPNGLLQHIGGASSEVNT